MEQGNVAKKLTGQILENWLLTLADGHGGIQTITKTGTSGLVDTYTIAFADETTSTFTVTNGRSISGLTTSKSGKVTTITITYNDNTTSSFTVRDGENVSSITEYWAVSMSGSQQPQSGWQTTPPTLTATYKYLWHYSKYTFSDGTNTSTTPAVQGVYGDKGDTGNTGTSITNVTKTGTSGLVDTYTITFSNGTTTTFQVTNGSEIESIEKTSTAGLVDTYTVTMGNGDTHTFTVTNGRSIVSFTQTSGTHAAGTIDVYTMTYNDGDTSQIQVYNGANGTGAVSTVAGIGVSSADGDVPLIIRGYGAPTTATVGQVNQLYFDMTGGIMYICIASAGGSYDWRGMSSAVDSAMSTTSANSLRNSVISNKVGVGSLSSEFSATNLTDAANELQTNKANLASPTFTGTPKAPTAAAGTNNTQLATTAFVQNIASDLNGAINSLSSAFKTVKNIASLDGLSNESCFFTANATITLSPTSTVIPQYSKGIFVTTGNDAIILAINSSGHEIIAYRNGSNWSNPSDINALISTLSTAVGKVTGTTAVSTEAQLIGASKFFDTTTNIPLGSTGVTLEAYARGVVLANSTVGALIAIGYSGKIYTAFFNNGTFANAKTFSQFSDSSAMASFTPFLENCTVTYTTQEGHYRRISDTLLFVQVRIHGKITAIPSSQPYALINISSVPDIQTFDGQCCNVTLREGAECCDAAPYNAIASGGGSTAMRFQLQGSGGTGVKSWVVTSGASFYINISGLFIRAT